MSSLPDELVQEFRKVAIERLERIETSWGQLLGTLDESAAILMHRELHTLKGESKMLGFADVNLVCHKLEDMVEVARARGYAVDEDFDLAVNMAVRFMGMLVRKKVGAQLGGIDLPGFIRQIDTLLAETRHESKSGRVTVNPMQPLKIVHTAQRIPAPIRSRLAGSAVDLFVEYAVARGLRRNRLRVSWHNIRDLLGIHRAVVGPGQLAKHKAGAETLARELGKKVDVIFDIGSAEATAEVLAAIDVAVLHLVRNAVDHGIESPEQRASAGKPARGLIRVHCQMNGDQLVTTVTDDGRGVALDLVRARAIERGLLPANVDDISTRWLDLVCAPGFSTRTYTTDVSGRGVGLDAVRAGILEVGGTLAAKTQSGLGSTWTITIPVLKVSVEGHIMRGPGAPFPLVLDGSWRPTEDTPPNATVLDIAHRLGLTDSIDTQAPRYTYTRGGAYVSVVSERRPRLGTVRRLLVAPAPALADVILLDVTEGLLVHVS